MNHYIKTFLTGVAIGFVVTLILYSLTGCATTSLPKTMSWDQENLKNHDVGCPTAIYIAPHGELVECEPLTIQGKAGVTTYPDQQAEVVHGFKTMEAAGIAALQSIAAKPTSVYYEWGGNIAVNKQTGEFFYAPATTSMHGDTVHIADEMEIDGFEVVATYHTHPCLPRHIPAYFSPGDLEGTLFYHQAGFMGDFCSGKVHEFLVGDKPDVEIMPHTDAWSTQGRIVGTFTAPRAQLVVE